MDELLAEVIAGVQKTPKYHSLNTEVITRVAQQEIQIHRNQKETIHQVRSRLHQISSAFFPDKTRIEAWSAQLAVLPPEIHHPTAINFCRQILTEHHSTAERLPFVEDFYAQLAGLFSESSRILDLGCGLNSLSYCWFPQKKISCYEAVDIHADLAVFLNLYFSHFQIPGQAVNHDVFTYRGTGNYDIAFLLKLIPVLEHQNKKELIPWLASIPASNLVISYPIRSLGGRNKGMQAQYSGKFHGLAAELNWHYREISFPNEIVYIVDR